MYTYIHSYIYVPALSSGSWILRPLATNVAVVLQHDTPTVTTQKAPVCVYVYMYLCMHARIKLTHALKTNVAVVLQHGTPAVTTQKKPPVCV
jgi:hypothetical protein